MINIINKSITVSLLLIITDAVYCNDFKDNYVNALNVKVGYPQGASLEIGFGVNKYEDHFGYNKNGYGFYVEPGLAATKIKFGWQYFDHLDSGFRIQLSDMIVYNERIVKSGNYIGGEGEMVIFGAIVLQAGAYVRNKSSIASVSLGYEF